MGRDKKDAGEALSGLRVYLRKDQYGSTLLEAVERYLGTLRQEKTTLKERVEILEAANTSAREISLALEKQAAAIRTNSAVAEARIRQLESDLASAHNEVTQLRKRIELDISAIPPAPPDLADFERHFIRLAKQIYRRMPDNRKIEPIDRPKRPALSFRFQDFINQFSSDEYEELGMFVAFMAMLGFPITIHWKTPDDLSPAARRLEDKHLAKALHWSRSWIKASRLEEKLFDANILPDDSRIRPGTPVWPDGYAR